MITKFDKTTGLAVGYMETTDQVIIDSYISSNSDCWIYEGEIDKEVGQFIYDGTTLSQRPNWDSIKAERDTQKREAADIRQLEMVKTSTISTIKVMCDEKDVENFEYPVSSGKFYKITDAVLKTLQRGAKLNGTDPIPCNGGEWDTFDGQISTPFTMDGLQQMYDFGYDIPESNYRNMKTHLANVEALTTVQSIVEYDYSTGWK